MQRTVGHWQARWTKPNFLVVAVDELSRDDRAIMTGILGDLAKPRLERLGGIEESRPAAGDDAFFNRRAGWRKNGWKE